MGRIQKKPEVTGKNGINGKKQEKNLKKWEETGRNLGNGKNWQET